MTTAEMELASRQSDVKEAEARVAAERHEADVALWKAARTRCRGAKAKFAQLERDFHEAEMAVAFLESGVARATANLADCAGPEPEDFPDDAEIADWETQRADLTRQLASVRESRMEAIRLREQTRLAAVEAADLLSALTRSEQNLYAKATGERVSLTAFEGGVTRVA